MLILKCLLLAYAISKMEFLQWIWDALPNVLPKYIIVVITSCGVCCSFWTTLIVTGNLYTAAFAYFIMHWYLELENIIKLKLMRWLR